MDTPKLSVTIITFNEEDNIRDCLESVKWADEIIVVDSFSTDNTSTICKEYTDKIIQREWPGHVDQKQFGMEQATGEWILSLDADERLSEGAIREVKEEIKNHKTSVDGYIFPRRSYYLGRWINYGGWYPDRKLRLVKKGAAYWGGANPHDKLITKGSTKCLKNDILHYVYRDISHQLSTVDNFSRIVTDIWHKEGKKFNLFSLLIRPPASFFRTYFWKLGFLDEMPGFIVSAITSYYVFLKYAKLWELRKNQRPTE
jgi:glycosyltransferase involved in cell wall biosynthesis